jgi:hypothetical protein
MGIEKMSFNESENKTKGLFQRQGGKLWASEGY